MDCLFCDKEAFLESELHYARFDKFPVTEGHCLIISKRHVETWFDLTLDEQADAFLLIQQVKLWLDEKYSPDGINIGMNCGVSSGQTVLHSHIHVIPRYEGDMSNPRGGVRGVIPEKQNY